MQILKPIPLKDRKPVHSGRYFVKFYGGFRQGKNWLPLKQIFGKTDNDQIEFWYKDLTLPAPKDVELIVGDKLPPGLNPRERELILQGASMAAELIHEIIDRA